MKTFFKNIGNTIVKKLRKHPLICNFVLSVMLAFVLEVLGRQTFDLSAVGFVDQRSKMFLYSIFIIFVTYSVTLITKRRLFSYIIVTLLWSIVGIVNFMMLSSRNTPFTYVDITLMKSVLPVMNNYFSPLEIGAMGALLLIALVLLVVAYMYLPIEEHLNRKSGFIKVIVIIAVFSGVTSYGFKSGMLVDQIHNIRIAFSDYGTPYCFSITALKNGIDKPSDYSEKKIKKIEKRTQKKVAKMKKEKVKKPNIIFVQLESHFDITQVKGVKFNKDPLPNFHKYMKGYSSGQLSMPSYGAGTANSEFELITGMNLDHFGAAEYPYKTVLQNTTTESMATVLKNYGYKAHAIHDNSAAFYDRDLVFSQLGFDTFTTKESMNIKKWTENGWAKDQILTGCIMDSLDSTKGQDYVYCISVQGHGAYPDEQILEDPEITVSGAPTEEENNKWEYYVNEIHEMDNFVKELTDKLADYPEDVVLVMYGDHLPTMGLTVEDLKNKYLFQTEYVMWDNFGLKKKNENLAAYQMAAEVMDRVGIHEGTVFRYHQARRNTRNYQVDLETLQYDLLYGKRYSYGESGESPYLRTRMRMGIYDVTLDSIQCISEADHTYYIKGTEFTPSSEIKLNGEWYDTVYINPTTLMITGTELNDFDRLAVIQRSNSSTRKPLSKSYDRSCYALYSNNKWKFTESAGMNEN